MSLLRFLGLGGAASSERESDTIRRIAGELEHLPPEQSKYLASFAYVLARLANADLKIDASETAEMERIVPSAAATAYRHASRSARCSRVVTCLNSRVTR